ncbi:hypothetical protein AC579_5265 [Pseudocercospora musae]|uniref:Uncharacterized protein n=1 Tax=Pseudocercospora musae TaxID=113226 RepID=A0A139IQ29_9PEZI|nr:hypothetical protein AC579_5265 [Pseudocercospora musae]
MLRRTLMGPNIDVGIASSLRHRFKTASFILTSKEIEICHIDSRTVLRQFMTRAERIQERVYELISKGYRGVRCGVDWAVTRLKRYWRGIALSDRYKNVR